MKALDYLQQTNGMRQTASVVEKQQSGADAAEKANPETAAAQKPAVFTQGEADEMGKRIDAENSAVPADATMRAARDYTIAKQKAVSGGVDVGQGAAPDEDDLSGVPTVKQEEQPKRMSYAEMYKKLYGENDLSDEAKAKMRKRERTEAIIASVGDGLRALGNMYFATKGAKVAHDPGQDMTAAMLKRRQQMDDMRQKNRAAWLTGYQKALALDEQADYNNAKLGETVRHNKELEDAARVKAGQGDRRLDQNQQKIDLAKLKYTDEKDYKNNVLSIKEALKNGQISHWEAQDALGKMREERLRSKAESSSQGNKGNAGYWYEYHELMDTPEGQKKIRDTMRHAKIKNANQTNIRWIMDRVKGRSSSTASGGGKTQAKGAAQGGKHKEKRPY